MAKKSPYTPGKLGHAPVNGRYFFVHPESRCVRTWDMQTLPVPPDSGWLQVSLDEWTAFRKETKALSLKKRKQAHARLYPLTPKTEPPVAAESVARRRKPKPKKVSKANG